MMLRTLLATTALLVAPALAFGAQKDAAVEARAPECGSGLTIQIGNQVR